MKNDTEELLKPFLAMMDQEVTYSMKPACYNNDLVNPEDAKCAHGSQWTKTAQKIMGGDLTWADADIVTDDNFHRVYTMPPWGDVHLARTTSCDDKADDAKCTLETVSVTENFYNRLDQFDTGKYPIAANEMKAKLLSRQAIQTAAGNKTADFHELDEEGNRCADINQASLDLALSTVSQKALDKYNKLGKKLVIGDDLGPYNAGPLWIWFFMQYKDNKDKTETLLQSPMMRTPIDYWAKEAAGFHYCKLLSPFRAVEWIYIDGLFDRDGLTLTADEAFEWDLQ